MNKKQADKPYKFITLLLKPALMSFLNFLENSNYLPNPVNKPRDPACKDPVEDHRPRNRENFASDAEDLAFFFIFNGRRGYAVGKAGDRHQRAGAAPFGYGGIDIKPCQEDTYKN